MKKVLCFLLLILSQNGFSQVTLQKVEPPFWWIGFRNPELQLLVYGKNIGNTNPSIFYPGVELKRFHVTSNPDYLFLDLEISPTAEPGDVPITFSQSGRVVTEYLYMLKARKEGSSMRQSFSSNDVIYLIMPDRFANGDTTNDNNMRTYERVDRTDIDGRHGGDIKGIIDHLDYLNDLGITTLWTNPLQENDMKKYSYHGYSITDFYSVDPRFGSNDDIVLLSGNLHKRGMKFIMDMVFNHCGLEHWWMKDLPSDDWIHQFPEFTRTLYKIPTVSDPWASSYDCDLQVKGWFDKTLPDLNQQNPLLSKYLIQNSIWWIEYAGLDGIRMDTYPYAYKDFMAEWAKSVLEEYPNFNIVGECWVNQPGKLAYWQKGAANRDGYDSYLPSIFDFAMYDALRLGFMENDDWNTGIIRLYNLLAQDFVYPDPSKLVVFADNHDLNRYLNSQKGDIRKMKMAMAFILTTRGIPEIYYGTEILLSTGGKTGDGALRSDFPGGWPKDPVNAFTGKGLSLEQADMLSFMKKLLSWRKNNEVIHSGKLTHFIPVNNLYVYFRQNSQGTVMVALNNHEDQKRILQYDNYSEFLDKFTTATDVITGKKYNNLKKLVIEPKSALILELH